MIVSLCWHLLDTNHENVLLGQFTTDPLERKNLLNFKYQMVPTLQIFIYVLKASYQAEILGDQNVDIEAFVISGHHLYIFWI